VKRDPVELSQKTDEAETEEDLFGEHYVSEPLKPWQIAVGAVVTGLFIILTAVNFIASR
jgi:hypothetical protein